MIKAVFIDVDDTLLNWDKNALYSIQLTSEKMGLSLPENIMEIFHKVNEALWHDYENGLIQKTDIYERRWKEIFEKLGENADARLFEKGFVENLHYSFIKCDYAEEIMIYLSKKYNLYVASNASYSQQYDRLVGSNLLQYVKELFVSERAGFAKPNKEFFDYCFKELAVVPKEVAMIGDSLNADISGAHKYGLMTIWINSHQKEKTDDVDYEVHSLKEIENIL